MVATGSSGGFFDECPICERKVEIEPSEAGDAVCPRCGHLFWPNTDDVSSNVEKPKLGGFRVLRELESEADQQAFLVAHDDGRSFILQALPYSTSNPIPRRLVGELKILRLLDHPNVLRVYGFREDFERLFVVKEFVEGATVQDWTRKLKRLSVGDALFIARSAAVGLECIHEKGIVHRSISPDSVLVTKSGQIKLREFGLLQSGYQLRAMTLHDPGYAAYFSPEQICGKDPIAPSTDLYALGCMTYESITGKYPFEGESVLEKMLNAAKENYAPASSVVKEIHPGVDDLLAAMMASDPDDRFASARELVAAIDSTNFCGEKLSFIPS